MNERQKSNNKKQSNQEKARAVEIRVCETECVIGCVCVEQGARKRQEEKEDEEEKKKERTRERGWKDGGREGRIQIINWFRFLHAFIVIL
jgi:hypothetical protein